MLNAVDVLEGEPAATYIERLMDYADAVKSKKTRKDDTLGDELADTRPMTMNAVRRSLSFVRDNLRQMEKNNKRLRSQERFKGYVFEEMPDPTDAPENIISPGTVSIFYLAGYDHLNQSAIVSIVLEALFAHRSTPFRA